MAKVQRGKFVNPFYVFLVIAGVAFTVTACVYGVMMYRAANPSLRASSGDGGGLMEFMHQNGTMLLVVELVALAATSTVAMMTDGYWRRGEAPASPRMSRGGDIPNPEP